MWVPAAQGMKKMVWTATRIEGGRPFIGKLAHPPEVDGIFQNFAVSGRRAADRTIVTPPEFYADSEVIAYRIPRRRRDAGGFEPASHFERRGTEPVQLPLQFVNAFAVARGNGHDGAAEFVPQLRHVNADTVPSRLSIMFSATTTGHLSSKNWLDEE